MREFTLEILSKLTYVEFMNAYAAKDLTVKPLQLLQAVGHYIEVDPTKLKHHNPLPHLSAALASGDEISSEALGDWQRVLYKGKSVELLSNPSADVESSIILYSLSWAINFLINEKMKQERKVKMP